MSAKGSASRKSGDADRTVAAPPAPKNGLSDGRTKERPRPISGQASIAAATSRTTNPLRLPGTAPTSRHASTWTTFTRLRSPQPIFMSCAILM
jgi:hypothetical protein